MSHIQYVRYCRNLGLPEEVYQEVAYPHPYILIWLECRRQANPWTGVPALPQPDKGYLEQDAELTLACSILDEVQTRREQEKERRAVMLRETQEYFSTGGL